MNTDTKGQEVFARTCAEAVQTARSLARTPVYALSVAGLLGVGTVPALVAVAIVWDALFGALPFRDSHELFVVARSVTRQESGRAALPVAPAELEAWRLILPAGTLAAYGNGGAWAAVGPGSYAPAVRVDGQFFDVAGITPAAGGLHPSAFLSYERIEPALVTWEFWKARLGGDLQLGGTLIGDDGAGIRVVGVLGPGFVFPGDLQPQVVLPLVLTNRQSLSRSLGVVGRFPQASDLAAIEETLAAEAGSSTAGLPDAAVAGRQPANRVVLRPIRAELTAPYRRLAVVTLAMALAVALLTTMNVGAVTAARTQERLPELIIRRALGARSVDVVRLVLLEQSVLVVSGVLGSLGVTYLILQKTLTLIPPYPIISQASINSRVLLGALLLIVVHVAVLVLIIAGRTLERKPLGDRNIPGPVQKGRSPRWLVAGQVSVAVIVTVVGSLVLQSLGRSWSEDPGLAVENRALIRMSSSAAPGGWEDLLRELRLQPGVRLAGAVDGPVAERAFGGSVFQAPTGRDRSVDSLAVTAGFLEAAGLAPLRGRFPTEAEFRSAAGVLVVSETVARTYWPGQDALGQVLMTGGRTFEVIGTTADVRYVALDVAPRGAIYWPMTAKKDPALRNVLVAFHPREQARLPLLVEWLSRRCAACHVARAETLEAALEESIRRRRFYGWFFGWIAASGLVVAGTGLLGLLATDATRRRWEISIRIALGATRPDAIRIVVATGAAPIVGGLLVGAAVAGMTVRFLAAFLYKTEPYDPVGWAVAVLTVVVIGGVAALVPAVRASATSPARVLRGP